ncbi:flagellar hook-basal body complex protein FliE [Methylocapsa acidiphila]|uniref:flagellar hook-basal body complex protein FliE n=1 Tax=Methylocapsa acidiphila TaxID=133552 RepID=UPI000428E727|nr:flagellar hook-basal body complex protein FliE [Methylocapsa acidiphila]
MIGAVSLLDSTVGASSAVDSSQFIQQASGLTVAPTTVGAGFGEVLADVSTSAINALKNGEATSIDGLKGKASIQQVVESVMNADQSLRTALAIRDKVVAAYQSLAQMSI